MALPTFARFLNLANQHRDLLRDLAAEDHLISRSRLFIYLDRHHVAPSQKQRLIDSLTQAAILTPGGDDAYALHPTVANLINYYERRGRLTNVAFLSKQILEIARYTDELQRELNAEQPEPRQLSDTLDNLYRLIRDVRESGDSHYQACMRLFGDLKRGDSGSRVDERLEQLETIQRRHIAPLVEIVSPDGEYARHIRELQRQLNELRRETLLLAQSQELTALLQRTRYDLDWISHDLLLRFSQVVDTGRALLKSLLEQKNIKSAVATCLANLNVVFDSVAERSIVVPGRRTYSMADAERLGLFFNDIIQRRYLPNPQPLTVPAVERTIGDDLFVTQDAIWREVKQHTPIASWPMHVVEQFGEYSMDEQLRVMMLPLITAHQRVTVTTRPTHFQYQFSQLHLQMYDFGLRWR